MKYQLGKTAVLFLSLSPLVITSPSLADLNDMMVSDAGVLHDEVPNQHSFLDDISLNDRTMVLGPSINNLDQHQAPRDPSTSSRGKAAASKTNGSPPNSYSLRHVISLGYVINRSVSISPVLDLSQPLAGNRSGTLTMNDPQLKVSVRNVFRQDLGGKELSSNLMFALYAPMSDLTKSKHGQGALSISASPRLQFSDSKFSLSGSLSFKSGFYQNDSGTTEIVSSRFYGGIQNNYEINDSMEVFLMGHTDLSVGPKVAMTDPGLSSQTYSKTTRALGLMTGFKFDATRSIAITPRLNWFVDQPLQATTVGINVFIKLI